MPEVVLYAKEAAAKYSCVISFNIQGLSPDDVGYILENSFGIIVRTGLHCAPLIHKALGSFPDGSIRVSPSCFTTDDEIDRFLEAVTAMVSAGSAV
jgi:selenocysteine lyase/cysteine desulfurase